MCNMHLSESNSAHNIMRKKYVYKYHRRALCGLLQHSLDKRLSENIHRLKSETYFASSLIGLDAFISVGEEYGCIQHLTVVECFLGCDHLVVELVISTLMSRARSATINSVTVSIHT